MAVTGTVWRKSACYLLLASASGVALTNVATSAQAQQVSAPSAGTSSVQSAQASVDGLEDIVVTARRVAENLQNVPVSVTSQSGEALLRQNALTVADTARLTPGFYAREALSAPSALNLTIRGQVQNDVLVTLDPSVGTYVDELYWARAYGLNGDLLDVQRVEVLRGPQGTLFGRNTTGGAVVFTTADPNFDGVSGSVQASYGRFNERSATAILNIPILDDKIAIRGAVNYLKRDGWLRDVGYANNLGGEAGRRYNNRDNLTGRIKLLIKPTERLDIIASGEIFQTNTRQGALQTLYAYPVGTLRTVSAAAPGGIDAYIGAIDKNHIALNVPPYLRARTKTLNVRAIQETGFGEAKLIAGYREVKNRADLDNDGSPFASHSTTGRVAMQQYSVEGQVSGKAIDGALDFVAGATWFEERGTDRSWSSPDDRSASGSILFGRVKNDAIGGYGQATYHITDKLSATGGIRYTVEHKGIEINNRTGTLAQALNGGGAVCLYPFVGAPPVGGIPGNCIGSRRDRFAGWSYTAGLDYRVTPGVLVYAKTSKGFRSGGQNLRAIAVPAAFTPFDPEVSYQHEVGLKSQFLDNKVRLNISAYSTKVRDFQATIIVSGGVATATIVQNAARVQIYGGEAELLVEVADGVTLGANGSLTRPKFKSYFDSGVDVKNRNFQNVPKSQFSLTSDYSGEVGGIGIALHADYSWSSKYETNEDPTPLIQPFITAPSSGTLGARGALTFMDKRLEVAVFGRNILNDRSLVSALRVQSPYGYISGRFREPATYGISATYRFGS